LPRIYKTVDITQSSTTTIDIPAPGQLSYAAVKQVAGQLFLVKEDHTLEWVANIDPTSYNGSWQLQPGNYRIVYRVKHLKSTTYTMEKNFKITSNKTTPINL
jgi:Ca-activated chloride channel family protein